MQRVGMAAWPRWTRVVIAVVALATLLATQFGRAQATAPGTVVAWGANDAWLLNTPAGLSGVIAIGAGIDHNLALKGDGTVVSWGCGAGGDFGQCGVPGG